MTQLPIPLPAASPVYAIARKAGSGLVVVGYTHAVDALAAIQTARQSAEYLDCGSIPFAALTRYQRQLAMQRRIGA